MITNLDEMMVQAAQDGNLTIKCNEGCGNELSYAALHCADGLPDLDEITTYHCCECCATKGCVETAVMTNIPSGVTFGVSYQVVSEHRNAEEAIAEANRLNEEAHSTDDQGRDWWSGYSYSAVPACQISDLRCGNIDIHNVALD